MPTNFLDIIAQFIFLGMPFPSYPETFPDVFLEANVLPLEHLHHIDLNI